MDETTMNEVDKFNVRYQALEFSMRLAYPGGRTAKQILTDAKEIEDYLLGRHNSSVTVK